MTDLESLPQQSHVRPSSRIRSPRSVLVPLDGSPAGASVIPVARVIAEMLDGTLHLLHVADPPLSPQAALQAISLEPAAMRGLVVSSVSGPAAEAIVQSAATYQSQLIAMCTKGWTADPGVAFGRVAEEVLRRATCPLLLVRPEVARRWARPDFFLSRVLLPLDGVPRTSDALSPAAELVQRSDAALDVLHVVVPGKAAPGERGAMTVPQYTDHPQHSWPAWRREFIERFCQCFARRPERLLVVVGEPAREIVRVAEEQGSELIVLAWQGRFNGSRARTVRSVLSDAPCPVLCLRTRPPPDKA